jgi:ankyrin repeat protein
LFFAASSKNLDLVKWLVGQGVDINAINKFGKNILFYAMKKDNQEMVQWLIEQGVDVNTMDAYGDTPLGLACYRNDLDMVKLLLEHGANINPRPNNTLVPFWIRLSIEKIKGSHNIDNQVIVYLILHDPAIIIASVTLLILIAAVLIHFLIIRFKKRAQIEEI